MLDKFSVRSKYLYIFLEKVGRIEIVDRGGSALSVWCSVTGLALTGGSGGDLLPS